MLSRRLEYQITGRDLSGSAFVNVQRSIQATEDRLTGLNSRAASLRSAFAGLTLTGFGAGAVLRDAGRLETTLIRLRGISNDYAGDQQFLISQSRALGLRVSELAASFQQLAVLEKIELLDRGQARELTVGFEEAAKAFGVGSEDIQLAVRGIRQALTQEVVRAQEFDQIFDAIGAVQPSVARQLNLTTEEFQKLRTSGTLLAKDLVDALIPALDEYAGSAATAAQSIEGGFRRIGNSYELLLNSNLDGLSDGFQSLASGIAGSLDFIGENSEQIATALQIAGTAAIAAFGGRAASNLVNFSNAQLTALASSNSLAQSQVANERSNLASARALVARTAIEERAARQRVASLNALRAQLTTETALTANSRSLVRARERLAAANLASQRSYAAQNTALLGLNDTLRRTDIFYRSAGVAARGFNAALSLVGGPVGVAALAIAALGTRAFNANKDLRNLVETTRDLRFADNIDQIEAGAVAQSRADAERKINSLIIERNRLSAGELELSEKLRVALGGDVAVRIDFLNGKIEELKNQITSLNQAEIDLISESETTIYVDRIQRLGREIAELESRQASGQSLIEDLLPSQSKLRELEQTRNTLIQLKDVISAEDFTQANRAIDDQISKLDGSAAARKRATQEQEKQLESLKRLRDGVLDEVGKINQTFEERRDNILELQVRLGDSVISDDEVARLIAQYREISENEIAKIDQKRADDEIKRIKEVADARQRAFEDSIRVRQDNNTALSGFDPVKALRDQLSIEQDLLQNQIDRNEISQIDAELRLKAFKIQNAKDIAEAVKRIAENNPASIGDFFNTERGIDSAIGATSNVLDLFTRQAGSYIDIQSSWTEAEKKRAADSNRINRRAFEQNKKIQLAQAIIEGAGAVSKAINQAPGWPFSIGYAVAAAAAAAKQIQTIKRTSFNSSGNVSFGGSGASSGTLGTGGSTGSQAIQDANNNGGGQVVYFVTEIPPGLEGAVNQEWLYNNQRRNLKRMVDAGAVSSDSKIVVSDTPAPQLFRRNQAVQQAAA